MGRPKSCTVGIFKAVNANQAPLSDSSSDLNCSAGIISAHASIYRQRTQANAVIEPRRAVGVGRRDTLVIARAIEAGEDIIATGRQVGGQRHTPDFAICESTVPQTAGQARAEWLLIVDPPLAGLGVTQVQELDVVFAAGSCRCAR